MLIPHGTTVAVIDAHAFALFRNRGNEAEPELEALEGPATLDETGHRGAGSHHSRPGNHDDGTVAADAHAVAVTEWLNAQVLGHHITHLVVVAPARILGELRRHYHKQLNAVLLKEVVSDLAGYSEEEVLASLRRHR